MRLLIIRHADPEYHGDTLTAHGHLEAAALADRLASGVNQRVPTHLYTSPLGRARDTAAYTEKKLGMVAEVEEWTKELSEWGRIVKGSGRPGEGGLALWDTPGEFLRDFDPPLTHECQWTRFDDLGPARQNFDTLCAHSDAFLARHGFVREGGKYRVMRQRSEDQIAVFCHGGFGLAWLAHLLQMPLAMAFASFHLTPSSVTTVLFDQRSEDFATPRLIGLGDASHMYAAGLSTIDSKYEKPNPYNSEPRPSGVKGNFW
ncbi:hypothetical protein FVE85_2551 [Porphyridium purpureum]|uniref:Histidine phosphatase family protein n=1 Tax=Porphyridium purpureum TaxID=35688 RepID=A0A5J4YJF0_PORPP|nr:hypothetical protein FVE85_2551 [Porphyridium purpureum]|eukprot:POR8613..scf291_13